MLTDSLEYLQESEDWIKTVVIGGVLGIFSFLIIPGLLVTGYLLRVMRATMRGDEGNPPVFDDWGEMAIDGLKAAVISIVYSIIPAIVAAVTVIFGLAGFISGSEAAAATGLLLLLVGGLVTFVLWLAVIYILPAAILNYAESSRLGAGFAFGEIYPVLTDGDYLTAFGYAIIIYVGFGIISGVLSIVPFLGQIVSLFIGFYAAVMVAYVYGRTYGEMDTVRMSEGEDVSEGTTI